MELVKREDRYDLYADDGSKMASTYNGKLSLKNCQAIERGYDLDEMAENATNKQLIRILGGEDKEEVLDDIQKRKFYFIEGAKAILEILGDKKFSEKDVKLAINLAWDDDNLSTTDIFQSLQQTEWDVEIEMEWKDVMVNGYKNQPKDVIVLGYEMQKVPKLDSNGCLILKL